MDGHFIDVKRTPRRHMYFVAIGAGWRWKFDKLDEAIRIYKKQRKKVRTILLEANVDAAGWMYDIYNIKEKYTKYWDKPFTRQDMNRLEAMQ